MAVLLITGQEALVKYTGQNNKDVLLTAELSDLTDVNDVATVLSSNLFKRETGKEERFIPLHRTVAEYLGARWLARQIDTSGHQSRAIVRLLGLISADGGVPASLRGLHAWLAHFSPTLLGPKVIDADPYGMLKYGDADNLSIDQARRILSALKILSVDDPYFRSDHWERFSAKGLVRQELHGEIRQMLTLAR